MLFQALRIPSATTAPWQWITDACWRFPREGGSLLQLACNRAPRGTVHCATELMRARLYWHDGRVEEVTVVPRTELIVRDTPAGFRHFLRSDEPDDDGFARFIEENVTDEDEWP